MRAHRTILLSIITLIFVLNLTAQYTSIEIFVYDDYTENPLDSAMVTVLKYGEVIDSSYTDIFGIANINIPSTSIREQAGFPSTISLSHNYPNPFSDETNMEIGIPEAQTIKVDVYNILGQRVASEQITVSAGYYGMKLSLGNLPQGVYFLRITGRESETVKLLKMGSGIHSSHPVFTLSSISTPEWTTIDKLTDDELTVKVVKERYKNYETSVSLSDNNEIAIPLQLLYVSDIDGNDYEVVKIGDQWWMAENLRVTKYRNGDNIPTHLSNTQWTLNQSGAYAIFPYEDVDGIDSEEEMVNTYGILYNWYAINNSSGLCPLGWHVPSDDDWKQFEMYLGMSQEDANRTEERGTDEGGKMKSTRTEPDPHPRWISPNTGATNESNFSGFPSGGRWPDGGFRTFDIAITWWSSTQHSSNLSLAWIRTLFYDSSSVRRNAVNRLAGFSVRCIRD